MKTDKAALDPYRLQSRRAIDLIKGELPPSPLQRVEKASIDEVFLDLSAQVPEIIIRRYFDLFASVETQDDDAPLPLPPTSILDWLTDKVIAVEAAAELDPPDWDDVSINIGCEIVRAIRQEIAHALEYTCSADIARKKSLAKLAAGCNKPDQQTVVRTRAIHAFLSENKFTKIRGLGGKLGQQVVKVFSTDQISQLPYTSLQDMRTRSGSSASWVYNVIRSDRGRAGATRKRVREGRRGQSLPLCEV